jgi:hypothetical protein
MGPGTVSAVAYHLKVFPDHRLLDLLQGALVEGIGCLDVTAANDARHGRAPFKDTVRARLYGAGEKHVKSFFAGNFCLQTQGQVL